MTDNDRSSSASVWSLIPPIALILGFGAVGISFFWPSSSMSSASWSPEQAKQYQSASVKLHSLSHAASHPSKDTDSQAQRKELEQAQKDYAAVRSQLDAAIDGPKRFANSLRYLGLVMIVLGGIGTYYLRPQPRAAGRH